MSYNYSAFHFGYESFAITCTKKEYTRTASGKSWKKNPDRVTIESVDNVFYTNYVAAIPFFAKWGNGSCRARWNYTLAGYLPVDIVTISPDRQIKITASFAFSCK